MTENIIILKFGKIKKMEISGFGRFIYQLHDLPNLCITAYSKIILTI
jgi:hypothetical protein